jgi:signal transduction histidine kinase
MGKDLKHEELVLVEKINILINSKTSVEEIFKAIIDGLINVFGYHSAGAYLLSDDKKSLFIKDYYISSKIARAIEKLIGFKLKEYKIPIFEGSMLKKSIENKEPIILNEMSEIQQVIKHHTQNTNLRKMVKPVAKMSGLKSGVGIPLIAEDEVVGMLGISSKEGDLTEKDVKRLEAFGVQAGLAIKKARMYGELEDYSSNLEKRVEEKTRELKDAQSRLIESEKFAAMGRLAAGVAHEINNPLGNISLAVELIMRKETDPYKLKKMEVILGQVENASDIVKNLLAYSRESEIKPVKTDLNGEITKTLEFMNQRLLQSRVELVKKLSPNLPIIKADPKKLQQVFLNLITNALQAMPNGGTLFVSTYIEDAFVVVEFTDTGKGIPKNIQDKVFDPFFTTKGLSTSAGLGLSVSKGIIDKHSGVLEIKDTKERGTSVLIKLPTGGC